MAYIKIDALTKIFDEQEVVSNLSFKIKQNSFTVLLGPSGCGKSTTLRMLAGLEQPDRGKIIIDGKDITMLPPAQRGISMVFQSYALFPHLTVKNNILFGLKARKTKKQEREKKLNEVAYLVGLENLLDRKPAQLSGGQKQRVALARSFVSGHSICLMDEPLSNLDAKLRQQMRREIKDLQIKLKMNVIYVTHDQVEAMSMADHIILLNNGKIEQQGKPQELYENVSSIFAAKFIGSPPMNILPIHKKEKNFYLKDILLKKEISEKFSKKIFSLGIRPEDVILNKSRGYLQGKILFEDYQGMDSVVGIQIGKEESLQILASYRGKHRYAKGEDIWIHWEHEKVHFFDVEGKRI